MTDTLRPPSGPPAPDPLLGQVVGGAYRIDRLLGSGGMGNVYEASHVRLPKRFAIKVVKGELAKDDAAFERFKREAEIASSLGNKHIVEVFDFNVLPDGSPYMVMEYLTGEDLATRLGRQQRLSVEEANAILGQVVSALDAAHARGIVHRDIKPENIFLLQDEDESEFVKLLDFGLSKIRGSQKRLTANLSVLGTPWYMSPEQARGDADLDHRTDLYALAVVLFQVLSGRVPFDGENVYGVLTQIATQPPPPIRQFAPDLPGELEAVLQKAMSKEPSSRPPSVREFWADAQSAMGMTVVRKSLPSARVPGPDGKPFRVPTPSDLQAGVAPTITTSRDKIAEQPIPLTRPSNRPPVATAVYGQKPALPQPTAMYGQPARAAIGEAPTSPSMPASPSMMALERAAFPQRSGGKQFAIGIAAGAVLLLIALGVWRVTHPAPQPTQTTVVQVPEPAPKPAVAVEPAPRPVPQPPAPVPAVAKLPEPAPKPAAKVEAAPRPSPKPVAKKKPKKSPDGVLLDDL